MRIAAVIEYDGSSFQGWQRQAAGRSVQACVEEALSRVADEPVRVTAAGRTDAGVHAAAQVVHFDTGALRPAHAWVRGGNSHLPRTVALLWAGTVPDAFHARYSATGRRYRYLVLNRPVRPTYLAGRATHVYRPLDVARMQAAARQLLGRHDFTSFRSAECEARSPVRELRVLEVARTGELVVLDARADAFLHHMVRNLAGVLIEVGAGGREPEWARTVLDARDRTRAGVTAPADGLYLAGVEYPEQYGIPRPPPAIVLV